MSAPTGDPLAHVGGQGRIYRGPEARRAEQEAWTCPRCKTPGTTFEAGCAECGFNHGPKGYRADEPPVQEEGAEVTPRRKEAPTIETHATVETPDTQPAPAIVTVYKLIEYRGPKERVEATLAKSLTGTAVFDHLQHITGVEVSVMPGTAMHQALREAARSSADDWQERRVTRIPSTATPMYAAQFWVRRDDGEYVLADTRVVNTIAIALLHFADDAQPQGDALSLSHTECTALAEALRKGHEL